MALINKDHLLHQLDGRAEDALISIKAVRAMIEDEPSIDAVPVIRCKDCKYWNGEGKYCDYDMSGLREDFCSWAERKES